MKILSKFFKGFKKSFNEKGFTLIELLVVIGILGILAAGLLAAIDPLEQFRKASDSNTKSTALELTNALTRYYAVHGVFPWDTVANGGVNCAVGLQTPNVAMQVSTKTGASAFNSGTPGCLTQLVSEGELKTSFPTQWSILSQLYVTDTTAGSAKSSAVCFNPQSKSEYLGSGTHFTQAGGDDTVRCAGTPKPANCYWCAQ